MFPLRQPLSTSFHSLNICLHTEQRPWTVERVGTQRYSSPRSSKIRLEQRRERKVLAGRYCQFLSDHVVVRSYLCDEICKIVEQQLLVVQQRLSSVQVPPYCKA